MCACVRACVCACVCVVGCVCVCSVCVCVCACVCARVCAYGNNLPVFYLNTTALYSAFHLQAHGIHDIGCESIVTGLVALVCHEGVRGGEFRIRVLDH